jgi:hypothetical protein
MCGWPTSNASLTRLPVPGLCGDTVSRIEINADGRHVIVEHDAELEHVATKALALWEQTRDPRRPAQSGFVLDVAPPSCCAHNQRP